MGWTSYRAPRGRYLWSVPGVHLAPDTIEGQSMISDELVSLATGVRERLLAILQADYLRRPSRETRKEYADCLEKWRLMKPRKDLSA